MQEHLKMMKLGKTLHSHFINKVGVFYGKTFWYTNNFCMVDYS